MGNKGCRAILSFIAPPLAVLDKGCGTVVIVTILWLAGWFPGVIAALLINFLSSPESDAMRRRTIIDERGRRYVEIFHDEPVRAAPVADEKAKGAYIRLADGETAEVVEAEDEIRQRRSRLSR